MRRRDVLESLGWIGMRGSEGARRGVVEHTLDVHWEMRKVSARGWRCLRGKAMDAEEEGGRRDALRTLGRPRPVLICIFGWKSARAIPALSSRYWHPVLVFKINNLTFQKVGSRQGVVGAFAPFCPTMSAPSAPSRSSARTASTHPRKALQRSETSFSTSSPGSVDLRRPVDLSTYS